MLTGLQRCSTSPCRILRHQIRCILILNTLDFVLLASWCRVKLSRVSQKGIVQTTGRGTSRASLKRFPGKQCAAKHYGLQKASVACKKTMKTKYGVEAGNIDRECNSEISDLLQLRTLVLHLAQRLPMFNMLLPSQRKWLSSSGVPFSRHEIEHRLKACR